MFNFLLIISNNGNLKYLFPSAYWTCLNSVYVIYLWSIMENNGYHRKFVRAIYSLYIYSNAVALYCKTPNIFINKGFNNSVHCQLFFEYIDNIIQNCKRTCLKVLFYAYNASLMQETIEECATRSTIFIKIVQV